MASVQYPHVGLLYTETDTENIINCESCFILGTYIISCLHILNETNVGKDIYIIINEKKIMCDIVYKVCEYDILFLKPKLNDLDELFNDDDISDEILLTSIVPNSTEQSFNMIHIENEERDIVKVDKILFRDVIHTKLIRYSAPYIPIYEFDVNINLDADVDEQIDDIKGISGCAVCTDDNKIVGMITSYDSKKHALRSIPIYVIVAFMDKINAVNYCTSAEIYSLFLENISKHISLPKNKHGLRITNDSPFLKLKKGKCNIGDTILSINGMDIKECGWINYMGIIMPVSSYMMLQNEMNDIPITIMRNKKIIATTINTLTQLNEIALLPLDTPRSEIINISTMGINLIKLSENTLLSHSKNKKNIVGEARKIYENGINTNLNKQIYYVVDSIDKKLTIDNPNLKALYDRHEFPLQKKNNEENDYSLFLLTKINNKKIKLDMCEDELSSIHTMTFVTCDLRHSIKITNK